MMVPVRHACYAGGAREFFHPVGGEVGTKVGLRSLAALSSRGRIHYPFKADTRRTS